MKSTNKWAILSLILLGWAIVATSATSYYFFQSEDLKRQLTSFERRSDMGLGVVVVDYGNATTESHRVFFQIGENDSAFNATIAALGDKVEYTYYPSFDDALIDSISGVASNSTHFWSLSVNGRLSAQGAMHTRLSNGDRVVWNLTKIAF